MSKRARRVCVMAGLGLLATVRAASASAVSDARAGALFRLPTGGENAAEPAAVPATRGVNFIYRQNFDGLADGPLSTENAAPDLSYPDDAAPVVITPEPGSPLFVAPGDKVLRISAKKKLGGDAPEFGNGDYGSGVRIGEAVTRRLEIGHTYYFDCSFQVAETTTIPLARIGGAEYTRFWLFANPVGGGEPGRLRGVGGNLWGGFGEFKANQWHRAVVKFTIRDETVPEVPIAYLLDAEGYFDDMTKPVASNAGYKGHRRPYGPLELYFTPWKDDGTDTRTARGVGYLNNVMIYEADGIVDPALAAAAP